MSKLESHEWIELLDLFKVPHQRIYILGSFARHATIYSQQVRALNLISALRRNGHFGSRPKVAVIGAGAAGLMAAAGAYYCGAEVTILDELAGPLELQRNNRQRWLHPHIYDWPFTDKLGSDAELPLLTWSAGYSSDVAEQIIGQWKRLTDDGQRTTAMGLIRTCWSVSQIFIQQQDEGVEVNWNSGTGEFSFVILAVGFGLEPEDEISYSYWSEDRLDGDFRKSAQRDEWVVSGAGDGGFTDLMRLCIRRFRHHEVHELFNSSVNGIGELIGELKKLHPENANPPADWMSKEFCRILDLDSNRFRKPGEVRKWDHLKEVLQKEDRLRKRSSPIQLLAKNRHIYGPQSSMLNRLIVSQLQQLGMFELIPVPSDPFVYSGGKYTVTLGKRQPYTKHHVVQRHGPKSALESGFKEIFDCCADLLALWKTKGLNNDKTRKPNWDPGEFGEERVGSVAADYFADSEVHVKAERLSIVKELRNDGSSNISFEIQGLTVSQGILRGVLCVVRATTGCVGVPQKNEDAMRLGMHWGRDDHGEPAQPLENTKEWIRQVSRVLYFDTPLKPGDKPATFGFSVSLVNGDALSSWEFEQMYRNDGERTHANGDPLYGSEFLARYVWFPIGELRIRITMPTRITSIPSLHVFSCPTEPTNEDIRPNGILQMMPAPDSQRAINKVYWAALTDPQIVNPRFLENSSPLTWDLSVPNPRLGSCYELTWALPEKQPDEFVQTLINEASHFRQLCLAHREGSRKGKAGVRVLRQVFLAFAGALMDHYGVKGDDEEQFEVSLMTYDENSSELRTVEAVVSGQERMQKALGDFKLPFGLGLAGAAFKEPDKVHKYERKNVAGEVRPSNYLPLAGAQTHEVLVSTALAHPRLAKLDDPLWDQLDRPRACLGVVNIGSDRRKSPLRDRLEDPVEILQLSERCQVFAAELFNKTTLSTVVSSESV